MRLSRSDVDMGTAVTRDCKARHSKHGLSQGGKHGAAPDGGLSECNVERGRKAYDRWQAACYQNTGLPF